MNRLVLILSAMALAVLAVGALAGAPAAQTSQGSSSPASSSASAPSLPLPDLPDDAPDDALATVEEDAQATLLGEARAWAEEDGISVEEAKRRLQLQDNIGRLDVALMENERDTYAGLWIKYEPEYGFVARFTRNGEQTIRPYVAGGPLEGLVEVRPASATLPQLEAARDRADRILDSLRIEHSSGTEVQTNSAVVDVTDRQRLTTALQTASLSLPQHVRVNQLDALPQPSAPFYAGLNLNAVGWDPSYDCTSGFTVRHIPTGDEGGTTAGHCKDDLSHGGTYFPKRNGEFSRPYDLKWFNTPGYEDRAWIRDNSYYSGDQTPGYRYVKGAKGRLDQPVDSRVCHFGQGGDVPEYKCGYIERRNYEPTHPDYNNAWPTFILVSSNGDLTDLGDSGGPWFDSNTALGIQSGGNWNAPGNTDGLVFYMSITYLNDDGPIDFNLEVQKVE